MTATISHESELQDEEIEQSPMADHNYTNSMSSTGKIRNETPYRRRSARRTFKSRQLNQNKLTEISEESLQMLRDIKDSIQNISKSLQTIASAVQHNFKSISETDFI